MTKNKIISLISLRIIQLKNEAAPMLYGRECEYDEWERTQEAKINILEDILQEIQTTEE